MRSLRKISDDEDTRPWFTCKSPVFTMDEKRLLVKLVNQHRDILNNKVPNSITIMQKHNAWEALYKSYLENTKNVKSPRTLKQLKRCWENLKGKARRGDKETKRLLRMVENQHNLQRETKSRTKERVNRPVMDAMDEDSDFEPELEFLKEEPKDTLDEMQNSSKESLDESFLKIKEALDNSECTHCACEKIEKNAKVQLMVLQKHLNEELHQLEMHLVKERLKNERELHKLHVHEMSLKIENERRRAEILDKELSN